MDEQTFNVLRQSRTEPLITASEISGPDRTLLYGYDTSRRTWHVYLQQNRIHLHVYAGWPEREGGVDSILHKAEVAVDPNTLVPDKRVYPAPTDVEFAHLLARRGVGLCWTTWNQRQWDRAQAELDRGGFYGATF